MKPVITIMLIAFWCSVYAQQDPRPGDNIDTITTTLDTIDLNPQSKMIVKQITEQLQQIEETKRGLEEKLIILLTGAGIDPKKVAGFTPDFKILSRK